MNRKVQIPELLLAVLFLCSVFLHCSSQDSSRPPLTYKVIRQNFSITIDAEGVIDAQKSHILITPMIWTFQPEISYLAPEGSRIKKNDIVVEFSPDKYEGDYQESLRQLSIAQSEVKKITSEQQYQRSLFESRIKSSEAAASIARLQLSKIEFIAPREGNIKKLEIERSEQEAQKAHKKLKSLESVHRQEQNHVLLQVRQAENKVKKAQQNLEMLKLKAPVDGVVVYELNRITGEKVKEGDALYPGLPVVKIPDLSTLQVNLQLSETDVQKLKKGQRAAITIPSLNDFNLPGHVFQVAKMAQPIRRDSKVKMVDAFIVIDSSAGNIVPGLTGRCAIEVGILKDTLTIPLDCIFEKDSLRIVYVREQGRFKSRNVTIGQKSADFVVVNKGLRGGEELALREPGQ